MGDKPKRRIKDVPCVICAANTRDLDSVCGQCRRLRTLGQEYEQRIKEMNEPEVIPHEVCASFRPDRNYNQTEKYLKVNHDLFLQVIEKVGTFEPATSVYKSHRSDDKRIQRIGIQPNDLRGSDFSGYSFNTYLLTPEQAEGIRLLMLLLHEVAAYEYREGYRYGASSLMKLAEGDMTTSEFDARYDKQVNGKE